MARQKVAIARATTFNDHMIYDIGDAVAMIKDMEFIWDCEIIEQHQDSATIRVYFLPYTMTVYGDAGEGEDGEPSWDWACDEVRHSLDYSDFEDSDGDLMDDALDNAVCEGAEALIQDWHAEHSTAEGEYAGEVSMPHVAIDVTVSHASSPILQSHTYADAEWDYIHPHWISTSNPCLGRAGPVLREAYRSGSLEAVVIALYSYLSACDGMDDAGKHWRQWENFTVVGADELTKRHFDIIGDGVCYNLNDDDDEDIF